MAQTLAITLLEAVRNYLDITWEDYAGDEKLLGIISRGIKYLDGVAGAILDYESEDNPRELLFEYCRYVRAGAFAEFQNAYLSELITLQQNEEVKAYAATQEENPEL